MTSTPRIVAHGTVSAARPFITGHAATETPRNSISMKDEIEEMQALMDKTRIRLNEMLLQESGELNWIRSIAPTGVKQRVFVSGSLRDHLQRVLKKDFERFGPVDEVEVVSDDGFFVHFTTVSGFQESVRFRSAAASNGYQESARFRSAGTLVGQAARNATEGSVAAATTSAGGAVPRDKALNDGVAGRKVFVGGLAFHVTEAELRRAMEQHGKVEFVAVAKDSGTGKSRGYGFVTYADRAQADAVEKLKIVWIGGKRCDVHLYQERGNDVGLRRAPATQRVEETTSEAATTAPKTSTQESDQKLVDGVATDAPTTIASTETQPAIGNSQPRKAFHETNVVGRKVFVGGFALDITPIELRRAMEHHGKIEFVDVAMDKLTRKSRGFGFVTYADREGADAACKLTSQRIGDKQCDTHLYRAWA